MGELTEQQRDEVRRDFERDFGGSEGAHKVMELAPAIGHNGSGTYHVHMGPEGPEEVPGQSCQFCEARPSDAHQAHGRDGLIVPGCHPCRVLAAIIMPSPGNIELALEG